MFFIDTTSGMVYPITMPQSEHPYDYRLDNAALIFPPQLCKRESTIFRLSADIDKPVNLELLNSALQAMLKRCPYYKVQLRKGLFWYYIEPSATEARVEAESRYPCLYLPYKKRGVLPFRVLAYKNRIIFEVSHFITDGGGALRFLNGLLLEYLRHRGETIDAQGLILECGDPIDPEEYEDSFHKHYAKGAPIAKGLPPALQLKGKKEKAPVYHILQGSMKSSELKLEAKKLGVTIGEFLTAMLIFSIQQERKERRLRPKPIRVSIPMNLRKLYPSKTMRNFVLTLEPEIDPRLGFFSFQDIAQKVHHFMRLELDPRMIKKQFARNVSSQKNPFLRIVPRIIKDPAMRHFYRRFGRRAFSTSLSNLGRVEIPEAMKPFIKEYHFIPPPHKRSIFTTSIAYNGVTQFFFGSTVKDHRLERRFFTNIRKMGISVSIRSNIEERR